MDACLNMLCIASEQRGPLVSPALYSYYSVTIKKNTQQLLPHAEFHSCVTAVILDLSLLFVWGSKF